MAAVALSRSAFQTRKPPKAARPAWKCAEEFKRWLRKLPCALCRHVRTDENPIEAAHVDHGGKGTPDAKGTSTKAADRLCIPLCKECHARQHRVGWKTFERSLPGRDAEALTGIYWTEWPGRREWDRQLQESGQ